MSNDSYFKRWVCNDYQIVSSKARSLAVIGAGQPAIAAAMPFGVDMLLQLPKREEAPSCLATRGECTLRIALANQASQAW
jgi:hypothetical protein